jgi:hypothetical protein
MGRIKIIITEDEHHLVLEDIKKLSGDTVAVSTITKEDGMSQNRVRCVVSTSTTFDTDMKGSFKQ